MEASLPERVRSQDVRIDRPPARVLAIRGQVPRVLPVGRAGIGVTVGFNPMQPGRIKRGDVLMFLFGLAMIAAALVWVLR